MKKTISVTEALHETAQAEARKVKISIGRFMELSIKEFLSSQQYMNLLKMMNPEAYQKHIKDSNNH